MVLQAMAGERLLDFGLKVRTMHLPDRFVDQASPAEMYQDAGLTAQHVVNEVRNGLGERAKVIRMPKRAHRREI